MKFILHTKKSIKFYFFYLFFIIKFTIYFLIYFTNLQLVWPLTYHYQTLRIVRLKAAYEVCI